MVASEIDAFSARGHAVMPSWARAHARRARVRAENGQERSP